MPDLAPPPALQPGGRIRVVAPSGPFEPARLQRGLAWLDDYELVVAPELGKRRKGFLAGNDDERLEELQHALDCPHTRAVWVARGGYGLARLLPRLTWNRFHMSPKWLVGFSDATALHGQALAQGYCSLHAPNGTTLADVRDQDRVELRALLSGQAPSPIEGLETLHGGQATGPLVGGNLAVLFVEAASGRLRLPRGSVLFLEDVTETSYRLDRMLVALRDGGHLADVAGVVLGDFTDCSAGKFGVEASDVLTERILDLGVPAVRGYPAGHGARNWPFIHGGWALLDASAGHLTGA